MIRTQVQIPDDLYERARRFSREREMSLAEVMRRGLELLLDRYPATPDAPAAAWVLPTFDGGETLVPLTDLKRFALDDKFWRSPSITQLAQQQRIEPTVEPASLAAAFWEEDDEEDFLAAVRRWRQES